MKYLSSIVIPGGIHCYGCYLEQESAPFVERDSVQGKLPKEQRGQNGDKESLLRKPDFVTDLDVSKEPLKIRN